jgi:hypothetical protein
MTGSQVHDDHEWRIGRLVQDFLRQIRIVHEWLIPEAWCRESQRSPVAADAGKGKSTRGKTMDAMGTELDRDGDKSREDT